MFGFRLLRCAQDDTPICSVRPRAVQVVVASVGSLEENRPEPNEQGEARRCAAAVCALERFGDEVDGAPSPEAERGPLEGGEFADVAERQGYDVELRLRTGGLGDQIFRALPHV